LECFEDILKELVSLNNTEREKLDDAKKSYSDAVSTREKTEEEKALEEQRKATLVSVKSKMEGVKGKVDLIKETIPELAHVRLGVLCSNALSMAGACAMAAVRAGADEVKAACYAGEEITRTAEFAAILRGRGDELGISCDIRHAEIKRITSQIERMCASARKQSDILDGAMSDKSEIGSMTFSQHDDRTAVIKAVEKLGYDLSEEDAGKVYEAFKVITAKKETISARELDTIVASTALQVPPTYRLNNYVINCGNVISASAHMKLQKGEEIIEGICLGDGPIDAAFRTVEQIIGRHYELDDFQIQAVTEGREAMGQTIVRLRSEGKLYSGRGISTDIVCAGIHAYLSALNKIVYEEE
jgi:2-isopropylmalate synthase